ncbi:hypothetical protein Tco_0242621 [Tanacetum coccineum]
MIVGGLPDMILGSVMASKPKTMQDAIEFVTELMDQKIRTFAERQAKKEQKKLEEQTQKQLESTTSFQKAKCDKGLYLCTPSAPTTRGLAIWPETIGVQLLLPTTREPQGRIKGLSLALSVDLWAITRGIAQRTNPNSNVVTGTFLLNNRYASILFDIGADRSFVSTAFSSLIDIISTTLDHDYDLGSFDVIIGMDCNNRHESRLNIISGTKTQKYLLKGCHVFLAHVTTKKAEDKSKDKRLEDVPIVQDFPEVFLGFTKLKVKDDNSWDNEHKSKVKSVLSSSYWPKRASQDHVQAKEAHQIDGIYSTFTHTISTSEPQTDCQLGNPCEVI